MSIKPQSCGADDPIKMAGRRLSCETIMFHQSVADRLGLNVTDHKCLDFLLLHGPSTAGELSQLTALTTGAITAVLDRLEKAGFVRREADPSDRRRVIVQPVYERLEEIGTLFSGLGERIKELAGRYSSQELLVIIDFMNRSCEVLHAAAVQLREEAPTPDVHSPRSKRVSEKEPSAVKSQKKSGKSISRGVLRRATKGESETR